MSDRPPPRSRLSRRQSRIGCADSPDHPGRLNRPQRRPRGPEDTSASTAVHQQRLESNCRLMLEKEAPKPKRSRFDATAASPGLIIFQTRWAPVSPLSSMASALIAASIVASDNWCCGHSEKCIRTAAETLQARLRHSGASVTRWKGQSARLLAGPVGGVEGGVED